MPLLALERVGRVFPPQVRALHDATFDIPAGGSTAIVGASGSGKSTLLAVLGLLDAPTSGQYSFDGIPTAALSDAERTRLRRDHIAFVFQAFHLVPHLTALENVCESLRVAGVAVRERHRRAADALAAVGLAGRTTSRPAILSGGEQQRVAVARALVRRPRLLLCDEPTGNLDSSNATRVLDLLLGAADTDCAVVVVTHDPLLAERCDAELTVRDGLVERAR